jgi:hypothetical protein
MVLGVLANASAVAGVTERVTPTTPTYTYCDHEPIRGDNLIIIGHQLDRTFDE